MGSVMKASNKDRQHGRGNLPGHPLVSLDASAQLGAFLEAELCCDDLETMAPHLWMMSTQSSASVRALHCHRLLDRQILITESPRLHLVWYYDRVFVKPLPKYLLSHSFWTTYLLLGAGGGDRGGRGVGGSLKSELPSSESLLGGVPGRAEKVRRAALGFIRTYRFLIRHESDLDIALSMGLLPAGTTWARFCAFVSGFEDSITDADVSGRHHYGDLRLTRLNFYCIFFLRRPRFEYLPEQYSMYFARYFGPLLFIFATVSVILSAMQLEIAVQAATDVQLFAAAWALYRWFSVVVFLTTLGTSVFLFAKMVYRIVNEWVFAIKVRRRRLRNERKAVTRLESGLASKLSQMKD